MKQIFHDHPFVARLFFAALLVLAATLARAQGAYPQANPVAVNASGVPLASVTVAICTANPGTSSTGCPGLLATIYTDITLSTPCSGTSGAKPLNNSLTPAVGSGCSNPGLTDYLGNVLAFTTPGSNYWCQYYGPTIATYVTPCTFPGTGGSSVSLPFLVVTNFGAKGDAQKVSDGVFTGSSTAFSSPTANFTSADVGKVLMNKGAGIFAPTTPGSSTATSGGTIPCATTVFYQTAYYLPTSRSVGSSESSQATGACGGNANTVTVNSPGAGQGATAWYLYASTTSGKEVLQSNAGCASPVLTGCAIGTAWTITTVATGGQNPASAAVFVTTIASFVDAHDVVLANAAPRSASSQTVLWMTDDTAAIQSAITAAAAAGPKGGLVVFPPLNYYISANLVLPDTGVCSNLQGAGKDVTFINAEYNQADITAMLFKGSNSTPLGCFIRDISFNGNAEVGGYGLQLLNGKEWSIEHVSVYDPISDTVVLGQSRSASDFYEESILDFYSEFTTGNFAGGTGGVGGTPPTTPPYGVHLLQSGTDAKQLIAAVKNASQAGFEIRGGGNNLTGAHAYGFPYATYSAPYCYEVTGSNNNFSGHQCDDPATDAFHFSSSFNSVVGGKYLWTDTTTHPLAGLANVDSGINGLSIIGGNCDNMGSGATAVNWNTGPYNSVSFFGISGCQVFWNEYFNTSNKNLCLAAGACNNARLAVGSGSNAATAFNVKGVSGQNSPLAVAQDSGNSQIFAIGPEGLISDAGMLQLTTSFTTAANTALQTFLTTTLCPNGTCATQYWSFHCAGTYQQNTDSTVSFGLQAATTAANLFAYGNQSLSSSTSGAAYSNSPGVNGTLTSTATVVTTGTNTTTSVIPFSLDGIIHNPANTPNVINFMVSTSVAGDPVVVEAGSYCYVHGATQ